MSVLSPKPLMYQNTLFYTLLRLYIRFWHNRVFYRKVEVKNFPTHLASDVPLMIVSNHQNTLMDALAVVLNVGQRQPYFLTRADIFKKKWLRKLLLMLKMLPVYRLRDGLDEMQQNDEIFRACVAILSNGGTLAAFPEGNHGVQYHLRPFKKGLARIALRAEAEHQWQLGLQILPCGLYYTHCRKMGERLVLNFGTPFVATDFREVSEQNLPRALTLLTRRMADDIRALMLHFEDLSHHDTLKWLTDLEIHQPGDMLTNVLQKATQLEALRRQSPDFYNEKLANASLKRQQYETQNLPAEIVGHPPKGNVWILMNVLGLLVSTPVALYGWVNSVLPFSLPLLITRRLKDPQFSSAIRVVLYALVTFPIFWTVQIVLVGIAAHTTTALLYALSLPPTGYLAHRWARWYHKIKGVWQIMP
ncbi:MAG: 1-acyl-sn-glycerol-3-phosphate acyltransferase [Runella sp.]